MFSKKLFGLHFLSLFSVLCVLLILKILNLFAIFTFVASTTLVLWLSWNLRTFWRNICPKLFVSSSGKAVLITGCDSGFGFMTAQALHKKGFIVFACCLNGKSVGAQALAQMNIKILEMDVTNEEQIKNSKVNVQNYLKETKSELWALVNNAGLFSQGLVEWGEMTDLTKVMDVNVIGLVQVSRHFLPMIRKSRGRVINIASCAGRFTAPLLAFYSMSKYAVIAFSDALRREMLIWNVKVVTIEPMHYQTPMSDEGRLLCSLCDLWERTSPEVKSDFGENFFHSMKERVTTTIRTSRPETHVVIDSIVDGIANVSPQIRYSCCDLSFSIMWWCMETLPSELLDKVFYLFTIFWVKPRALDNGF